MDTLVKDNIETATNMTLGMIINYGLTLLLFDIKPVAALGATAVFFVCSYMRTLAVRRWFRKREEEK